LELGTDIPSGKAQQIAIDTLRKARAPIEAAGPAPPWREPTRTPMWHGIQQWHEMQPTEAEPVAPETPTTPARTFSGRLTPAQQAALSTEDLAAYREKFPGSQVVGPKAAAAAPVEDADAVGPAGISLNDLANSNLFGNKKFAELPEVKKMQVRSQKYGFDRAATAKSTEPPAPISVAGAQPGAQIAVEEGAQGPVQTGTQPPQPVAPAPAEPVAQPTAVESAPEPAPVAEAPKEVPRGTSEVLNTDEKLAKAKALADALKEPEHAKPTLPGNIRSAPVSAGDFEGPQIITEEGLLDYANERGISEEQAKWQLEAEGHKVVGRGKLYNMIHGIGGALGLDHNALSNIASESFTMPMGGKVKSMTQLSQDQLLEMFNTLASKQAAANPLTPKMTGK
jgi:hypothetical protein